ncbi:polysaccharide biosynthesis C-terminal domain-containing protein [Winogradskyella sp. F6397]|uniref:Polysaccharide biosynthesis C-terminal domain-containing protein n=1 Tax=Winogradskyella marina TaxID=2785530 RepID=A0ABS0EGH9_9FLAO|nr:lipid II flippase MurJ [Winogradskyella marina]MBF8149558.1 polysaccharide biosynthesis C-terminal domain-containing protein [Winogradskyella marina]
MSFFDQKIIIDKIQIAFRNPVVKSMATVAVITFFIKALAFYKETIIAGTFGLSEILDTFLVAVLVPSFVQSVFISSLKNLFIPNYIVELKNNGDKSSFQSFIFLITLAVSISSIILAYFFVDFFLEFIFPGKSEDYYQLTKYQLYIILPSLLFWGFSSVISGLLEIENRFLVSTLSEFFPLVTMLLFLFFLKDNLGDMVLAYGTLAGSVIGFIFLLYFSIKHKDLSLGTPRINTNSSQMLKQLPPKIIASFLSVMNGFIDKFFAGQLVVGSIAALNYGNRVPAFGVTIVIMALGSVLLPHFSRLVNEDLKSAYHYLFKILKLVVGVGIIITIITIFSSDWIVQMWLERNEFTHEDTLKVSTIQKIMLANVPFYLCTLIIVKFLTSINKNKFMAQISFVNLFVNIILNMLFIEHYGVFGLALSTTLVLIISSCFYFGFTYKQYKKINI